MTANIAHNSASEWLSQDTDFFLKWLTANAFFLNIFQYSYMCKWMVVSKVLFDIDCELKNIEV